MSEKLATQALLKIKVFWNKVYDVITKKRNQQKIYYPVQIIL